MVATQSNTIPTIGHVNDSWIWYVANRYKDSTKSTLIGTRTTSFSLAPESSSTSLAKLTLTEKDITGATTYIGVHNYRISSNGVATRLSETSTLTSATSTSTMNLVYQPKLKSD